MKQIEITSGGYSHLEDASDIVRTGWDSPTPPTADDIAAAEEFDAEQDQFRVDCAAGRISEDDRLDSEHRMADISDGDFEANCHDCALIMRDCPRTDE